MKRYKIGQTEVGMFKCARDAAVFHHATEAVVYFGSNLWLSVASGELITVVQVEEA